MTVINLPIEKVRIDGGTQFRVTINKATVEEYAESIKDGAQLPPAIVFFDSESYWLADGFHRRAAYELAGCKEMPVSVEVGSQRDAMIFSLGANADHGLRRSNDDKLKSVIFALRDPELSKLSQREIARMCGVTQAMVSKVKNRITPPKGDNGYRTDADPAAVLAALDEKARRLLVGVFAYGRGLPYDAPIRQFEQLALLTHYADRREWSALSGAVVDLIIADDPWLKLERDIYNRHKKSITGIVGVVKAVIETVAKFRGWTLIDKVGWNERDWARVLATEGYVLIETIKIGMSSWEHETYIHIAPQGLALLGLPAIDAPPAPTLEQRQAEIEDKRQKASKRDENQLEKWKADQTQRRLERPVHMQLESIADRIMSLEDEINHCVYLEPVRQHVIELVREAERMMREAVPEGALDEDNDVDEDDELDGMDEFYDYDEDDEDDE